MADPWAGLANMRGYENEVPVSQHRPLMAKKEVLQGSITDSAPAQCTQKRQVNSNACGLCRKRKSKCDGVKPHCLSCTTMHMTHCNYDLNKDLRRKGALRQKLKEMSNNYQFIIDSLCHAEEPHLDQLIQLIRSSQSIEVIADTWRSSNFPTLDHLQAASLLELDGTTEGNSFGDWAALMQMATNQPGINVSQLNLQTNQPSINISQSNVQINQPSAQMPQMPVVVGMPD